mgnify:CR=1 FL=1
MGATTALLGASAGLDIFSGLMGMRGADIESQSLRDQARLLQVESEADIARYARETAAFKAEQSVRYLKSGVTLEGSPLEVLDETTRVASENINAMRARATTEAQQLRAKGRSIQAASRLEFLKSVAGAASTTVATGSKLGWWTGAKAAASESSYRPSRTSRQGSGSKTDLGYF